MATKQRHKSPALPVRAAQSKQDVVKNIRDIGDKSREFDRLEAEFNDKIAALQEDFVAQAAPIKAEISLLQKSTQAWCEANRNEITDGGKVKYADFVTGMVKWRTKPPSCNVRGADAVIALLEEKGLDRFIRTKKEVNKDAILNEKDAVKGLAGITIVEDVEEFVIEPTEQSLENA